MKKGTTVVPDTTKSKTKSAKRNKAKAFFEKANLPPLPKIEYPKTSGCLSPVNRPERPPPELIPQYNPDDKFSQIEQLTKNIDKLVTNYEETAETEAMKMRQDFDLQFGGGDLQPHEIVKHSQKVVENLLVQNKDIKNTQDTIMGGISTWLKKEESMLKTNDIVYKTDEPTINDEMLKELDTVSKKESALKAVAIHSDIVSKSQLVIKQLEKKIVEQEQIINDLKHEAEKKVTVVQKQTEKPIDKAKLRELEEAKRQIAELQQTVNNQNRRIEELIVQSIRIAPENESKADLEEMFEKNERETKLEMTEKLVLEQKEMINDLNGKIRILNNDKEFLLSRIEGLEQQNKTQQKQFDSQIRDLINVNDHSGSKKDNGQSKIIAGLRADIENLKEQSTKEKAEIYEKMKNEVQKVKDEAKQHEIELKQIFAQKRASQNMHNVIAELKEANDQQINLMNKLHATEIGNLKQDHEKELQDLTKSFQEQIKELKKKMEEKEIEKTDANTQELIEKIKNDAEKSLLQKENEYNQKMQNSRSEFMNYKSRIEKTIIEKDTILANLQDQVKYLENSLKEAKENNEPTKEENKQNNEEENPQENENEDNPEVDLNLSQVTGEIRKKIEEDYLQKKRKWEQMTNRKLEAQKIEIYSGWKEEVSNLKNESESKFYQMENKYKDQIAELQGQLEALTQESIDSEIDELKSRIITLQLEKDQLIEQNKQLIDAANDGIDNNEIHDLKTKIEKRENEINELKQRMKDLQNKKRYVPMQFNTRDGKIEFFHAEPFFVEASEATTKEVKMNFETNVEFSLSPTKEFEASQEEIKQVSHVNESTTTELFMLADAETLTVNQFVPQLRICLGNDVGYVFAEVPEIETESDSDYYDEEDETVQQQEEEQKQEEEQQTAEEEVKQATNEQGEEKKLLPKPIFINSTTTKQLTKYVTNETKIQISPGMDVICIERPEIKRVHHSHEKPDNKVMLITNLNADPADSEVKVDIPEVDSVGSNMTDNSTTQNTKEESPKPSLLVQRQEQEQKPNKEDGSKEKQEKETNKDAENKEKQEKEPEKEEKPKVVNNQKLETINETAKSATTTSEEEEVSKNVEEDTLQKKQPKIPLTTSSTMIIFDQNIQPKEEPVKEAKPSPKKLTIGASIHCQSTKLTKELAVTRSHTPKLALRTLTSSIAKLKDADVVIVEKPKLTFIAPMSCSFEPTKDISNVEVTEGKITKETEKASVSCQVDIIETKKHAVLKRIEPIEIISVLQQEISPEVAPTVEPAEKMPSPRKTNPLRLVNKEGEIVEFPPRPLLQISDNIDVLDAGKQIVSNEAAAISHSLALVMSEIQSIEDETDETKKNQMQSDYGVKLDIEKDNLISELKERITELELINKHIMDLDAAREEEKKNVKLEINPVVEFTKEYKPHESPDENNANNLHIETTKEAQPILNKAEQESFFVDASEAPKQKRVQMSLQGNNQRSKAERTINEQNKEIAKLKEMINQLQNKVNKSAAETIGQVADKIADDENKNAAKSDTVIISGAEGDTHSKTVTFFNLKKELKDTIIDAKDMSTKVVDALDQEKQAGTALSHNVSLILNDYERKIDPSNPPELEDQAKLIKNIRDTIAEHKCLSSPQLIKKDGLNQLYDQALAKIEDEEVLIQHLQNEIINLKKFKDASSAFSLISHIEKELNALLQGREEQNELFRNYKEAQQCISSTIESIKNDGSIVAAKATTDIEDLSKVVSNGTPQWFSVIEKVKNIRTKLENDTMKSRNEQLIKDLQESFNSLKEENSNLRKADLENERDRMIEREKHTKELERINELYKNAQSFMQLMQKAGKAKIPVAENSSALNEIAEQLKQSQELEKQHLDEIKHKIEENNELQKENERLEELLKQQKETFRQLFNSSKDNQADKMISDAKISDVLKQVELANKKIVALEGIRSDLTKEVENLNKQMQALTDTNEKLNKQVINLENEVSNAENNVLKKYGQDLIAKDPKSDSAKLIKIYMSKIDSTQQAYEKRGKELISMSGKRADDRRTIVMLNAEISRMKSDLRFQNIRYLNAKDEADHVRSSITARDEIIREQKREIARLRTLIERFTTMKQISALSNKETAQIIKELAKTGARINYKKAQNPPTARKNKFDDMLMRERQKYAMLERQRKEAQERRTRQNLSILKDVALLAREDELKIPESIVIQMLPKPKPIPKVETTKQQIEFARMKKEVEEHIKFQQPKTTNVSKEPSYADRLQAIGEMQGKYSQDVVRQMLANARHGKVVVPANTIQQRRTIPMIMGKPLQK